jgi:hypothetical protein
MQEKGEQPFDATRRFPYPEYVCKVLYQVPLSQYVESVAARAADTRVLQAQGSIPLLVGDR